MSAALRTRESIEKRKRLSLGWDQEGGEKKKKRQVIKLMTSSFASHVIAVVTTVAVVVVLVVATGAHCFSCYTASLSFLGLWRARLGF